MKSLVEPSEHGSATCDDDRVVENFAYIDVTRLDRIDDHLVDTGPLETDLVGAKQDLRRTILLRSQLDNGAIRQVIVARVPVFALSLPLVHILADRN